MAKIAEHEIRNEGETWNFVIKEDGVLIERPGLEDFRLTRDEARALMFKLGHVYTYSCGMRQGCRKVGCRLITNPGTGACE
jgi:hypothetical protein